MADASASAAPHELAIFYLCALAALTAWGVLYRDQVDRRKYTLQAILVLTGLLAVGLAAGSWLLDR